MIEMINQIFHSSQFKKSEYISHKTRRNYASGIKIFSISGLSVLGIVELDFAGEAQSSSNDGMTLFVDLDCYLSFSELGMFSSSYFRVFYDKTSRG